MNRRNLLKVLPLAAMIGATVKIGELEITAHEMKDGKKYVFVVPSQITPEQARRCRDVLCGRGIDATVCSIDGLQIYELQ